MNIIYGDFETYYSKTYSLRIMTPAEYILGPEYETIMCGIAMNDDEPTWFPRDEVADYLRAQTEPYMFVSHNALFDATILAWRYNIHPAMIIDTMGMARSLLSHKLPGGRLSLDVVSAYVGGTQKNKYALKNMLGLHADDVFADEEISLPLIGYQIEDVKNCRLIYTTLKSKFPPHEHAIMDIVLKMATQPMFMADQNKLYEHLAMIQAGKASLLDRVGLTKEDLLSNDKFADALRMLGIEPPTKISLKTGNVTYAFAKTDKALTDLEEDPDEDVQALVSARLGIKSTLEESRTQRFISIAQATQEWFGAPYMPIPLKFGGAHTHRLSGDWKINAQNLPSRKTTALRESLCAPEGHTVLAVDASQIEARLTAWLCGQWDLVADFEAGVDVYSGFASDIYGRPINKKEHILERLLGKISILALGFGMGHVKARETIRIQALENGYDIHLSEEEVKRIVTLYRNKYDRIKETWDWLNSAIGRIANGTADGETFGPFILRHCAIEFPGGLGLVYEDLQYRDGQWTYHYANGRKHLYGGKLLENLVQFLDRMYVMMAALTIRQKAKRLGFPARLKHQVHDELIYIPTLGDFDALKRLATTEMSRRPIWGQDLPTLAEAKAGPSYGALVACKD